MNVLTKNIENRNQVEFVSLEEMVPADLCCVRSMQQSTLIRCMNL